MQNPASSSRSSDHCPLLPAPAAPLPAPADFTDNERDVLRPAVRGTLEVLEAAHRAGTVKRVVVTSSFAAMENYGAGTGYEHVYTEEDWCQLTYEQAKEERRDQL